jgi:hypothetical protein
MHLRRTSAGIATSLVALATFGAALPSGAADTEVQFTVTANSSALSVAVGDINAVVDNAGANPIVDALNGATLTDTLPTVTVTDKRGQVLAGWTLTVAGEDFVSTTNAGHKVTASNVRIYNNVADATALTTALGGALSGMTVTGGAFTGTTSSLAAPYTLLAGTTTLGNGSVVITPTAAVTIPAGTQAGTYTGTVSYTAS